MYFSSRYLRYETNSNNRYADYGEVVQIISDKLINVNMGGSGYILEAVGVTGDYIPSIGDWVTINWNGGNPVAQGGGIQTGLRNINDNVKIISTGDLASGVVNSDHIRANTIEARHISAQSIQAEHISANQINATHISSNSILSEHISANQINANHITANSIGADKIQANAIQTQHISANAVQANQISANSISSDKVIAGAIQAGHITANAINATHISANAVQTNHISANTIQASHIKAGAITATAISANQINAGHITANAINAGHISSNSIQSRHISANSIQAQHISAGAITATAISANSITGDKISANSISSNHITSDAIQGRHIAVDSIDSEQITANAINATHITANAINAGHITANAIQSNHISSNTIVARHISADAINATHISANSIYGEHISANQVSANHIGADQINATHISANSVQSEHISANSVGANHITANSISGGHIQANTISGGHIQAGTISANHITANSISGGHIQANTISSNHITANAINTTHLTANSITGQKIQANTISGNHITANAINATHITANSINASHITANSIGANHITANAINTNHLSANSITGQKIQANTISGNHITANAINATHITANAITSQHISANSIQANHISANAVTSDKISANSISGGHIQAGTIDTDKLTVGTRKEGLLGQYFIYSGNSNNKFQVYKGHQIDPTINFNWGSGSPSLVGQSDSFSVRWQGFIYAPETGTYSFHIIADDSMRVVVNNTSVVNQTSYSGGAEQTGTIALTQGNWYPILVEMTEGSGSARAELRWTKPSLVKEIVPSKYYTQGNTVIDGQTITTGSITASAIKTGTITADSGIIADLAITTAHIASGAITSANIGYGEIKDVHIETGNIKGIHIENATIDYTKISSVDADTITVGRLNGQIISGGTITGDKISGGSITGFHISANSIDALQIKAGAITTSELASHVVTSDKIQAGAITSDAIRVGSITAEHISTVGLDARLMQVYGNNGETLIGDGFLRVDGLDVGVVQSDNLLQNGLFLASSSDYGYKRENPSGEALLGNTAVGVGSHQVWKIDLATGVKVKAIDIPSKKPFDIAIHPTGNYGYITVQGDDTLVQLDLANDVLTDKTMKMGMGPSRIKFTGMALMDMKHLFIMNTDPMDMNIPDSMIVVDSPPTSVNGDLYRHHEIVLGNGPYDFVVDENLVTYITMADQGDIVVVDTSHHDSSQWKIKGRIPISAYGTDNEHGGLPATFGLQEVTGGDASGQYNASDTGGMAGMESMSHSHGGYGSSDGSLKTYTPHGIIHSSDPNHLYVVDYKNGELVVVDKTGQAPYNALIGGSPDGSFNDSMDGMDMTSGGTMEGMDSPGPSPEQRTMEVDGGGPGTYYVRYRITLGDSPDFIEMVNGKIFVTLEGSNDIAIIDEQAILDEINADNSYYGKFLGEGAYENWNVFEPMRTVNPIPVRYINNIGSKPTFMQKLGNSLYVTLSGQNQIKEIDTTTETITRTINTGTNPKGFAFTPDNQFMYVANYGGSGELSFIYPKGTYIGDPFMGLEGGINYQGADGWTPDRSEWTYDASGNIRSKSTVEFHINEPLLNEGGYTKLTAYGYDYQYAQIEQDITNVTNYSNGNNLINAVDERLVTIGTGNTVFRPKTGEWINNPAPSNIKIGEVISGNEILTLASANQYTIYYGDDCRVEFSANVVPSGGWVQANYTSRENRYFKYHNSSMLVAIENGSSPNFEVNYEIDEFVPKFVVVDNQQTSPFTPTADGVNEQYDGLEYSVITNRALGMTVTSSVAPTSGTLSKITDGGEVLSVHGDNTMNPLPSSTGTTTLPSGNQWVKVDLGKVYMIGKVQVAHSYGLDRVYQGTKTQVSEDGNTWYTIYDSEVSGTYNEKPAYHALHNHTHYAKTFEFPARPVRYVRDYANGWKSGDGLSSGSTNDWTEIAVFGDWEVEKGYTYPANSPKAGQQIATNGYGFVSTDISKAYIAMNIQIEFTSWWYMTYIVGPQFGRIKIEMPTLMNSGHFLTQEAPFVNNVAHRHIMSFPPSYNIKEDVANGIKTGKHRVVLRQDSGRVTIDRLRFEDYQYYNRSPLLIPTNTSSTVFTRYRLIAEQARWYQGTGRQSTEGAYDTPRVNSDTGLPDKSVPIKYRVRLRTELNADGTKEERGTAYITSAIFETGKQHTHWRRSESVDVFPTARLQAWNPNQPHNTGITHDHLANGAVRGAKIMANTVMDYHISNYARISEHKLDLNHPTHAHGYYTVLVGQGPMGTDMYVWNDTKDFLNSMTGWAGSGGNLGTANTVARGDHSHDYLPLSGGQITNTLNTSAINTNGNLSVTGNISVTGTVDGVDVAGLNTKFNTLSGNVTNHIGSGGTAHAVAISGGANGFIDGANYGKLLRIQDNAINQTTADSRYLQLTGGAISNTLNTKSVFTSGNITVTGNIIITGTVDGVDISTLSSNVATISSNASNHYGSGGTAHAVAISGGANGFIDGTNYGKLLRIQDNAINQNTADGRYLQLTGGALTGTLNTKDIYVSGGVTVTGNIAVTGTVDGVDISSFKSSFDTVSANVNNHIGSGGSAHAIAVSGGANGFIDGTNYGKLLRIQDNAINQTTADSLYIALTGGTLTGDLIINTNIKLGNNAIRAGGASSNALVLGATSGGVYLRPNGDAVTTGEFVVTSSNVTFGGNTVWHSGNFNPANKSDTNHVHAVANTTTNGFMSFDDFNKLATVQQSANNYIHPTTTGNKHLPSGGASGNFIKWSADGTGIWSNVTWTDVQSKPTSFTPSAHTHTVSEITDLTSNYYNKTEVGNLVGAKGDVHTSGNNTFHLLNTFDNAGLSIKIQPSANVTATTKLFQINNASGNELFSVNYSGGIVIAGDFTVTGQQIVSGTTSVNGDYSIDGKLTVGGDSTLGDASTDTTTVNGTLKVQNGSIQEVGKYTQVHRRPIYGIAGDLQFQTDSTVFEDVVTNVYSIDAGGLPTVQSGATRYYRLYVVYSDDITTAQQTGGQKATIRLAGSTNKDIDLARTWGDPNGRIDAYSAYFTDLPTGNITVQAKLATAGNSLGIRWIELIAYDKF